jgi:serine protease Do
MLVRCVLGLLGAVWVLSVSSVAHAQCSKDTDCKGERVCEGGKCVAPAPPAAPPAGTPPAAAAPPATSPPAQGGPSQARQKAIGFSNLVFRLERGDEIGIANENFRIHILEDLRRRGLNAVGAENLVFESDRGGTADLVLGGTVSELDCKPGETRERVSCRIGVEWQVLDTASDTVVYKVLTRSAVKNATKEPVASLGRQLIVSNLSSLASRAQFRRLLAPEAATAPAEGGYVSATLRACSLPARSMPAASEQVLDATVLVQTSGGFGSGFVASPDGYVVTAAHVVSGSGATIKLRDGREFAGTLIRSDRRLDIALLRMAVPPGTTLPCLPMKLDPVPVGSDAYAVGSPARRELSFSLARGIVSGVRVLDGVQYLQTDAAVNRGNSGGALVNASGESVAVVSSKLVGVSVEGVAFGVPLNAGLAAIAVTPSSSTSRELVVAQGVPTVGVRKTFVDRADAVPALAGDMESESGSGSDSGVPMRRHSTGMMAGGIVMTSFAPIAFLVAAVANAEQTACESTGYSYQYSVSSESCGDYDSTIYGGVFAGLVLAGVGIPLIVVGAKKVPKEPAATARITPWATPRAAGVGLRIDM